MELVEIMLLLPNVYTVEYISLKDENCWVVVHYFTTYPTVSDEKVLQIIFLHVIDCQLLVTEKNL